MITRSSIILGLLFLTFLGCKESRQAMVDSEEIQLAPLIEVKDLQKRMGEAEIMIIDMRKPEYYEQGHIEGAVNVWRDQLVDNRYPYGGMMATRDSIEDLLGSLGISNKHSLVIYDDRGCPDAARLWWLLKFHNYNKISLLNGGLEAWQGSGMKLSNNAVHYPTATFELPDSSNTNLWIDKESLVAGLNNKKSKMILIDTRTKDEFLGNTLKPGAKKAGRIPGSLHIDWAVAVDFKDHKKIRSADQLRDLFEKHGITESDTVVVYCHSGSRSSLTTFVLTELLEYPNIRNYDGSWTEWSHFDHLPYDHDSLIKTKSL